MIETLSMRRDTSMYGRQDQDQRIDGYMPVWADDDPTGDCKKIACDHKPFGFHDLLNMVNPLQHIPVVQNIYRAISGDTIEPESQAIGDTIYGGPMGGAMSIVNILVGAATGDDITGHLTRLAFGAAKPADDVRVATAATTTTTVLPPTSSAEMLDVGAGALAASPPPIPSGSVSAFAVY